MTTANINVRQILIKRGNTTVTSTYTGPLGELVLDTDLKMVRVQDGVNPGGVILANSTIQQNQIDSVNANVANLFTGSSLTILGNVVVGNLSTDGSFIQGKEMTEPPAPPANGFVIYAEDNGSGKTRLMVKFASGAPQQLAIEP